MADEKKPATPAQESATDAPAPARTSAPATSGTGAAAGNVVPGGGDHDRVVMLSLHADGTPAQVRPEIIGDKEVAKAAAREQFAQQAVSAADVEKRGVAAGGAAEGSSEPDAVVKEIVDAHQAADRAARERADSVIESLHQGLGA